MLLDCSTGRWSWVAAACLALATGCVVSVGYPRPGQPVAAREGQTLVFGSIRAFSDGAEYRPWDPTSLVEVPLYLALLRLGPRHVAPGLRPLADGSFYWWLPPGDYALIGNPRDPYAEGTSDLQMQDMHVLALLRVPASQAPAYAGELHLELASPDMHGTGKMSYGFGERRVDDDMAAATGKFSRRFGAAADAPAASLMCAGEAVPAFDDPRLFERGRALLDAGCRDRAAPGR